MSCPFAGLARRNVSFSRDGPDLVDDLLGKIGAGLHRLIVGAFHIHRCGAIGIDIDPDATRLAFAAAFLALSFPLAFAFSLAFGFALTFPFTFALGFSFALAFGFSFQLSVPFALSKGVGAHAERNAERGYAGGKCQVARRDTPL
jgi:hypothetical protein